MLFGKCLLETQEVSSGKLLDVSVDNPNTNPPATSNFGSQVGAFQQILDDIAGLGNANATIEKRQFCKACSASADRTGAASANDIAGDSSTQTLEFHKATRHHLTHADTLLWTL